MATDLILFDIIFAATILLVAYIVIRIINHFIKKAGETFDLDVTVIQVLQELVRYSIIVIIVILILNFFGVNITGLVLSLGILGIAVGFAARDTLSNFISGLFVLGTKSFKVGDFIEISDKMGTVTKMGFRVTTVVTVDNKLITIPNSLFSTDPFVNYMGMDKRRVELDINIPYELDLEKVIRSMELEASQLSWALSDPKPQILVKELGDLGVKVTLNVWANNTGNVVTQRSELALKIREFLNS